MAVTVIVNCYIEPNGKTSNVHAVRITSDTVDTPNESITAAFEKSAVDAVMRYKFKPASKDGKPVPVELNVNVSFHL
jgi:outer membrane biosynthesis protein TonB